MSIKHLIAAAEYEGRPRLSPSHKLALMAYADDASDKTDHAFPGVEKIQQWAGVGERRALQLLADLVDRGLLEHVKKGFPGKRAVYRVLILNADQGTETPDPEGVDNRESGTAEPVDNSEKIPAGSCTHSEMGAIQRQIPAGSSTPLLITPLREELKSLGEVTTGRASVPPVDDGDSFPGRLGWTSQRRLRKVSSQLDAVVLTELLRPLLSNAGIDTDRQQAIVYLLAVEVLGRAVKSGTRVEVPNAYVLQAIRNDEYVWVRRALDVDGNLA